MNISALITNYNTWQLTNICVRELDRFSKDNLTKILVIDDCSQENFPEILSNKVQIIHNLKNLGYVSSVNIGVSNLKDDVVIVLDSDAYPLMDLTPSIAHLFVNNPKLGAVGFKLVDENGNPTGSYSSEPNVIGLLLGQKLESWCLSWFSQEKEVPLCLHSCGMAIRRIAFEEVGGFDEDFDFLDADIDFSMKLRDAGWHIQFEPSLIAFHKGGGSFQTTAKRVLRHHRNRWRLLAKHGLLPLPWLVKVLLMIRHLIEYCFLGVLGKLIIKDSDALKDKMSGRRQLINQVWSGYGNV